MDFGGFFPHPVILREAKLGEANLRSVKRKLPSHYGGPQHKSGIAFHDEGAYRMTAGGSVFECVENVANSVLKSSGVKNPDPSPSPATPKNSHSLILAIH
jgi:hypothetical protein